LDAQAFGLVHDEFGLAISQVPKPFPLQGDPATREHIFPKRDAVIFQTQSHQELSHANDFIHP
jgi:hypothetical protein